YERIAFYELLVAERNRHKHNRAPRCVEIGVDSHCQHAALCRQQPASAASPTFHEILDGVATGQYLVQVRVENRGVEPVPPEAPPQEKGSAPPQDRTDYRHVQVDAGGRVRNAQTLVIHDIAQQQVVDVAPVTGHVHHLVPLGRLVKRLDVVQHDAVVDPVPKPAQEVVDQAD